MSKEKDKPKTYIAHGRRNVKWDVWNVATEHCFVADKCQDQTEMFAASTIPRLIEKLVVFTGADSSLELDLDGEGTVMMFTYRHADGTSANKAEIDAAIDDKNKGKEYGDPPEITNKTVLYYEWVFDVTQVTREKVVALAQFADDIPYSVPYGLDTSDQTKTTTKRKNQNGKRNSPEHR